LYRNLLIYSGDQVRKHRFLIATKLEKIFLAWSFAARKRLYFA